MTWQHLEQSWLVFRSASSADAFLSDPLQNTVWCHSSLFHIPCIATMWSLLRWRSKVLVMGSIWRCWAVVLWCASFCLYILHSCSLVCPCSSIRIWFWSLVVVLVGLSTQQSGSVLILVDGDSGDTVGSPLCLAVNFRISANNSVCMGSMNMKFGN